MLVNVLAWGIAASPAGAETTTAATTAPAAEHGADAVSRLRETLHWLADDARDGRGIGTPGLDAAADYLADRFSALGLKPAPGLDGYFQKFEMNTGSVAGAGTVLSVEFGGEADKQLKSYELNKDYVVLNMSPEKDFAGPVVFAGYGVQNEKAGYDDYAGLDVKDRIVLVLRYEPRNSEGKSRFTGDDWSRAASFTAKARLAARQGAKAIIAVNPPPAEGGAAELMNPGMGGGRAPIPVIQLSREAADELLKAGGAGEIDALQNQIDETGRPQSRPLAGVHIRGKPVMVRSEVPVKNVAALLPGKKDDEFVVVGAHYDHLGRGAFGGSLAVGSQDVHNGADDNASGTSALLELARRLAQGPKPERSILFVAFTGEEEGLFGSRHFVENPPVPTDRMAAMLNLDMVGRIRNQKLFVGGSGTNGVFEPMLKRLDEQSPLELSYIGRGGLGPSDHASFAGKKIPVLFFFSGMHSDYHRPTDDPGKINYEGVAQVVDLSDAVVAELTTMPRGDYIAKFDGEPALLGMQGQQSRRGEGGRAALGVIPDYGTDESTKGVRITGTAENSAARDAGLKEGDVIIEAGPMAISSLYDLTEFLGRSKPGEKAKVVVLRDGQRVEFDVTLGER